MKVLSSPLRTPTHPDPLCEYDLAEHLVFWLILLLTEQTFTLKLSPTVIQVQEKCYQQIDDKVGTGRLPTLQDKLSLPYVEATAMEVLRKSNTVPFGVQHAVSEDVVFRGYFIPKNAIILPLMESILSGQQIWTDPDAFRPERFLDDDGKCVQPDEFIPFSLGKCLFVGQHLKNLDVKEMRGSESDIHWLMFNTVRPQFILLPALPFV